MRRLFFLAACVVFAVVAQSLDSNLRAATVLSNLDPASSGFGFGVGTNDAPSSQNLMRALTFRTGLNQKGYRLNSVTLNMGGSTGSGLGDFQLQLFACGPFSPTTSLGDFTMTSNPTAAGQYTFAFSNPNLNLSRQTYYAIVARSPGSVGPTVSQYGWRNTFGAVDPISDPDWQIFDHLVKTEGGPTWSSIRSGPYQFSIDATAAPEPAPYFLAMAVFAAAGSMVRRRGG